MTRAVRWLLRLFPRSFRERYGEEVIDFLIMRTSEVRRQRGWLGVVRLWSVNLLDLLRSAPAERRSLRVQSAGGGGWGAMGQHLRYGWRMIRRNPGFSAVVIATVALGVGVNTAVYSVVHGVLLRPLPYVAPEALVGIFTDSPPNAWPFSVVDYEALTDQQTSFERLAAYTTRGVSYQAEGIAERVVARFVTPAFFATLGRPPAVGRDFRAEEGVPGVPPAVIVGHRFWRSALGGREGIVGAPIRLDGESYTVVGIAPPSPGPLEIDAEIFPVLQLDTPQRKGPFFLGVVGRLRTEVARTAAIDELRAINRRIFPIWQSSYRDERATWGLRDLRESIVQDTRQTLLMLQAAVGLVLLVACTNVANLILARTTDRGAELALRSALGASRGRLVGQMTVEVLLLAGLGGVVGVSVAAGAVRVLQTMGTDYVPRLAEVGLDLPVLASAGMVTCLVGLVCGAVPAVAVLRAGQSGFREADGRTTDTKRRTAFRRAFVVLQFAATLPLLFGTALFGRSLERLHRVDLGFEPTNLLTVTATLPEAAYPDYADRFAFWDEFAERVRAVPGVVGVAVADTRPPGGAWDWNNFNLEDQPTPPGQSQPVSPWVSASPEFFDLLGIPLLQGRTFDTRDDTGPLALIVDRAWVQRFFPNEDPLGKRLESGGCTADRCGWNVIVGVVPNVKFAGLESGQDGVVYFPWRHSFSRTSHLLVRTDGDPGAFSTPVRAAFRSLDPALAISEVSTGDELVAQSIEAPTYVALLVGGFALVALVVAGVGIYGVMSYFVRRRAKDLGVRIALGGTPRAVAARVVLDAMVLVLIGVGVGVGAALVGARGLRGLLFEVTAADPIALAAAVGALTGVAVLSCVAPARRASRADPMVALRSE